MKIASRALSCILAASLCCISIPALAEPDAPASILETDEVHSEELTDIPSTGSGNLEDAGTTALPANPSSIDESDDAEADAQVVEESDHGKGMEDAHEGTRATGSEGAQDSEDPNPPQFVNASVSKTVLNVGDTLTISYDISDAEGVSSISLILINPNGNVAVRSTTGEFATQRTSSKIMSTEEPGVYRVIGYRVVDGQGFVSSIISSQYEGKSSWSDGIFGKTFFRSITVLSYQIKASSDPNPPAFIGDSIDGTVFHTGDSVNISCGISDKDGISTIAVLLVDPSRKIIQRQCIGTSSGQWASCLIVPDDKPGLYKVIGFRVSDKIGYVSSFIDEGFKEATDWAKVKYGTCTFESLPSVSFLVANDSKADAYRITDGVSPTIQKGTDKALTLRIDGELSDFVVATINGKDIPSKAYDLKSGSTIITLKPSYLDSLATGQNEFAAWYSDGGNATTAIKVMDAGDQTIAGSDSEENGGIDRGTDSSNAGSPAEIDRIRIGMTGVGLLQTSDRARLSFAIGLLVMGSLLGVQGTSMLVRRKPFAS